MTTLRTIPDRNALAETGIGVATRAAQAVAVAFPHVLFKIELADLVAVARLSLIRAAELYDEGRQQARFTPYAYRAAYRAAADAAQVADVIRIPRHVQGEARSALNQRHRLTSLDDVPEERQPTTLDQDLEQAAELTKVRAALDQLDQADADLLTEHAGYGVPFTAIAEATGDRPWTVGKRYRRSLGRVRELLGVVTV